MTEEARQRDPKPSLFELARAAKKALILGNGGGGDVIQGIPVAKYLRDAGVAEVILGGVNCQWADHDPDNPLRPGSVVLGPEIYELDGLTNASRHGPCLAELTGTSTLRGRTIAETAIAQLFDWRTVVVGLAEGVPGASRDLHAFVENEGIDLVLTADVGSDSFFTGNEVSPAHTSLVDFLSLGILTSFDRPTVFCLGGYGCDGELLLDELEQNIATAMQHGGFLGAHGLTQQDVLDMDRAFEVFYDPIGAWAPRAARGVLGWASVPTSGPWGQPIRVTPLAAVNLFFDPAVLVEHVCTAVPRLAQAKSLVEAEDLFETIFGVLPETRLVQEANLRRPQR